MHSLETCCLLSTSLPLKTLSETRVEVETNVDKGKQQTNIEFDLSLSLHEENNKKGVSIEEHKSRRHKGEVFVQKKFVVGQQVYYFPPKNCWVSYAVNHINKQ